MLSVGRSAELWDRLAYIGNGMMGRLRMTGKTHRDSTGQGVSF
jgi:hypothetical protein